MRHVCFVMLVLCAAQLAKAAPSPAALLECLSDDCDIDSGPVCAIDESGSPQTFNNRCTARLAFCRFGSFFAEVKPGEC
ncbi:unnamed protein product [Phyllotreta striolata]|uniref:Kazal-like domain-containing protein n=1 Tax=Phyllotreta striolata TaxID=444603 RepID=A0A9N9TFE6_PHYSR|nr:unnamed protein product [Phyllotreta striolata]